MQVECFVLDMPRARFKVRGARREVQVECFVLKMPGGSGKAPLPGIENYVEST
jgi:hypothetical protein